MISVITAVYNTKPFLRECLDSIVGQTYKDLDIIIVDDGSTDGSGELCDEYKADERVRVFHTENRGVSAALNLGIEEAKGEYFGFVDSDDWIEPDTYEVLLRRMTEEDAAIGMCSITYFSKSASKARKFPDVVYDTHEALAELIKEKKVDGHKANKLFKREVFDNVRFPEGRSFEDIYTLFQLIHNSKKLVSLSDPKYHYRQRSGSITKCASARNLVDYVDASIFRYEGMRQESGFEEEELLFPAVNSIFRMWRLWHGCSKKDKIKYKEKPKECIRFMKQHIPLYGFKSWPKGMRLLLPLLRSDGNASFAIMYYLNRIKARSRANKKSTMGKIMACK